MNEQVPSKELSPLPCPHCGAQVITNHIPAHRHVVATFMPDAPETFVIECACGAGMCGHETMNEVVERWNRRSSHESPTYQGDDYVFAAGHYANCGVYEGTQRGPCSCRQIYEQNRAAPEPRTLQRYAIHGVLTPISENGVSQIGLTEVRHAAVHDVYLQSDVDRASQPPPADDPVRAAAVASAMMHADTRSYSESADATALKRLAAEVRRLSQPMESRYTLEEIEACLRKSLYSKTGRCAVEAIIEDLRADLTKEVKP